MKVVSGIGDLIGDTPLLKLSDTELFLKLEKFNAAGSMKDRTALSMIAHAEQRGILKRGSTIVDVTAGNTGKALAMLAASNDYKYIAVVDNYADPSSIAAMEAFGARVEIVEIDPAKPYFEAVEILKQRANQIAMDIPDTIFLDQSSNPDNPKGYVSLANEIKATVPNVKSLIGYVGLGGSLCGTGENLKKNGVTIIAVDWQDGSVAEAFKGNKNPDNIPGNVDFSILDHCYESDDIVAFNTMRFFARKYGILFGSTSGAVVSKALEIIHGKKHSTPMVALLCDGGEKYLDTVFNDDWMQQHSLLDGNVEIRLKTWLCMNQEE